MKKLIALFLILCLTASFAVADGIDLSALSFEELLSLRNELNAEIMSRQEWKEVSVPEGTWEIGADIPEGTYSISAPTFSAVEIYDENGKKVSSHNIFYDLPVGKVVLKKGWTLKAKGPITMAPPLSLGF